MNLTSAQANKLLRRLREERDLIAAREEGAMTFVAALQEDVEEARPEYDFEAAQRALNELDKRIMTIRHAVNIFNTTHHLPGFDLTIDEALVRLPQLRQQKDKLRAMAARPAKQRVNDSYSGSSKIEYTYANYDIHLAQRALDETSDTLAKMQMALDIVNTQEAMDIDIEL